MKYKKQHPSPKESINWGHSNQRTPTVAPHPVPSCHLAPYTLTDREMNLNRHLSKKKKKITLSEIISESCQALCCLVLGIRWWRSVSYSSFSSGCISRLLFHVPTNMLALPIFVTWSKMMQCKYFPLYSPNHALPPPPDQSNLENRLSGIIWLYTHPSF